MTLASNSKQLWQESFDEQIARHAYNTAPVEALVRTVSYYLRGRHDAGQLRDLHFLEMGCGAGPNLLWLAEKGIRVSGIDLAGNALGLARDRLAQAGLGDRTGELVEGSVVATPFADESFDGILEACVFQHLDRDARRHAFAEVRRLLKRGGVFVGYMLDRGHSTFVEKQDRQVAGDPGSLYLADGTSKFHLTNLGLAHFFQRDEFVELFEGFSVVDPCLTTYYLPVEEARRRGYEEYLQSMWTVYAVK
jgi:SAM-dependent methyltransferase